MGIDPVLLQQRLMCPAFCDPVLCDDDDLIGIPDGGETVGDGDGRPSFGELFQALLDPAFALVIKGAGCFVKDKDRRIFQKYTGDGDALFLSRRRGGHPVLRRRCHSRPEALR